MTIGVVVFPGSNCDHDVHHVMSTVLGARVRMLWHKETDLSGLAAVILPGGFSYGDYLRSGAMAKVSPIMGEVKRFADAGRPVLGICNGFQVLVEARILPGALVRNRDQRFICRNVALAVATTHSPYTAGYRKGQVVHYPIAHADGNYEASEDTLKRLEDEDRVAFRYAGADGVVTEDANPNGSMHNIAGVLNGGRNVLGLMPHPERNAEPELGDASGLPLFESLLAHLEGARV